MKSSIVLATYNGEKYLKTLLDSLQNQTEPYFELIIVDDCSNDSTQIIIRNFSEDKDNVKYYFNEVNLGWKKNFYKAMRYSSGDVIFFCDQDDVWNEKKIEIMMNVFENNNNVIVLGSKLQQIDENGALTKNINMKHLESSETGTIKKIDFDEQFQNKNIPGCLLAIKSSLLSLIEYNTSLIPHDSFFYKTGILLEGAYNIDVCLTYYRIHGLNSSGASNNNLYGKVKLKRRIENITNSNNILRTYINIANNLNCKTTKKIILNQSIVFNNHRTDFLRWKLYKFFFLIRYKKYYSSVSVLFGDLTYIFGIQRIAGILYHITKK